MEGADRNGSDLRRLLRMADLFKDAAIFLGSRCDTPWSSVSASLVCVTRRDQYLRDRVFRRRLVPRGVGRRDLPVPGDFAVRAIVSTPPIGSCALANASRRIYF
jgi:hypothetical protein